VWFAYSPDRKGEHPEQHLRTFQGGLQADAYAGFNQLYKEDGRDDFQLREGHWVIADLRGKGGHIRTIPVPQWVKEAVDMWALGAGIDVGPLLRSINKAGRIWGHGFTPKVIWAIVKANAKSCGLATIAPHDLRRTCARLCHQAGGELEKSSSYWSYLNPDDRAIPRVQAAFPRCGQRSHRSGVRCVLMIGVAREWYPLGDLPGVEVLECSMTRQ
jgi:transposase IS66 family protein